MRPLRHRLWNSKHCFVPRELSDFLPSLHIWKGSFCFCSFLGWGRAERSSHLHESCACTLRLCILLPGLWGEEKEEECCSGGTVYRALFFRMTIHHRKRTITVCSDFSIGESHCINHGEKWVEFSSFSLHCLHINQRTVLESGGLIRIYSHVSRLRDK